MKRFIIDLFTKHPGEFNTALLVFALSFPIGTAIVAYAVFFQPSLLDRTHFATCVGFFVGGSAAPYITTIVKGVKDVITPDAD